MLSDSATPQTTQKYRFLKELAQGGMGRVEIAIREEGAFRRVYAIKRLREAFAEDRDVRVMFMDEARIAGLISHPNAVPVLDVGEDERGPYMVMDFVHGIPISRLATWAAHQGEILPVQTCVEVARQACEGLHSAHELRGRGGQLLGLVHRDVSPQNILLGFDGAVRVTDFGIAKALGRATETQSGHLKGKLGYMSPEQLRFEAFDRRSDIFSLGVVLFELLAGERLYGPGDPTEVVPRILDEPPPDLAEVRSDAPPALVDLMLRLLAKSRDSRPPTADAVARRLDEILAQLVLEEGKLSLKDFLDQHFADLREGQRKEIEELTARVPGVGSTALTQAPTIAEVSTARLEAGRARGPRSRVVLALAIVAVAGALGVTTAWLMAARHESAVTGTPTPAQRTPGTRGEPDPPAAVEDHQGTPGPAGPPDNVATVEPDRTAPPENAGRPADRTPSRLRDARTKRRQTTKNMAGELWTEFE